MTPYDSYSVTFPLWLGSLWFVVTFVWLLLPLCLHLWRSGQFWRQRGESPLDGYAREGVLCRISLAFVVVFVGLAILWDNYLAYFIVGLGIVAIVAVVLPLSRGVFERSRRPSSDKRGNSAAALRSGQKHVSSPFVGESASLGPCSEEAEAALTDEVMLSLWYGGLNGVYARKFRGAGRWIGTPLNHTPPEYLRAWASDNPYLRALAYYIKAVLCLLSIIVVFLLFTSSDIMVFADFWEENITGYDWSDLVWRFVSCLAVMGPFFLYCFCFPGREWRKHYRTLSRALEEGRDPDLSDRARMGELRRTILGWAWNSGYVRYDREAGWRLNAPSKGSKGGRLVG
ncbi:MAG: hypothetical protein Q4A13_09835 [Fretibacterium sp.]|nr:hypothetical protein [Fretibacterium sp.]